MAGKLNFDDLAQQESVSGTDEVLIVNPSGDPEKATLSVVKSYVGSAGGGLTIEEDNFIVGDSNSEPANKTVAETLSLLSVDTSAEVDAKVALKINITDIADNLTTDDSLKVLSGKQGKNLEDNKLNKADIEDNLTTSSSTKGLSAGQGKTINDNFLTPYLTNFNGISQLLKLSANKAIEISKGSSDSDGHFGEFTISGASDKNGLLLKEGATDYTALMRDNSSNESLIENRESTHDTHFVVARDAIHKRHKVITGSNTTWDTNLTEIIARQMFSNRVAISLIENTDFTRGDRTSDITVTSTLSFQYGSISKLINGDSNTNDTYFTSEAVSGKNMVFDFGAGSQIAICQFRISGNYGQAIGTYKFYASEDGTSGDYREISDDIAITLNTAYTFNEKTMIHGRYLKIEGVSGNSSSGPWLYEIDFGGYRVKGDSY